VITNGNGESLGGTENNPDSSTTKLTLSAGSAARINNLNASVQFTSSKAGKYYYSVVNSGAAEPSVSTAGIGASCAEGSNTVTVYMTAGAKDLYIKVKDTDGNVSDALKIAVTAYSTSAADPDMPDFSNIVITGGTVVYLNPAFASIIITFGP
jgi:hypothetical protein